MTTCQAPDLTHPPLAAPGPLAARVGRLLQRWFKWQRAARAEGLLSREAMEVQLLAALHERRRDPVAHTPDALRDAYRLFNGGDPFRFL